MPKPLLKQITDLSPEDMEQQPVWIGCTVTDYDEPWYDETDEGTFRPWTGDVPVSPSEGMLLVRATFRLKDGSQLSGFAIPAFKADDLGTMQPNVFVNGRLFGFWGGIKGISEAKRQAFYSSLGKSADQVFPLEFAADATLTNGICTGKVSGFYKRSKDDSPLVEHQGPKTSLDPLI